MVVSRSRHLPQNTDMVKERGRKRKGRSRCIASKKEPSQVKVYVVTIYTILLNIQGQLIIKLV